jgi:hypothetical protein
VLGWALLEYAYNNKLGILNETVPFDMEEEKTLQLLLIRRLASKYRASSSSGKVADRAKMGIPSALR